MTGLRGRDLLLAGVLGLLALAVVHPRTLVAGAERTPGDCGDTRFNHYLLEHTWGWVAGEEHHQPLWDLPMFFPAGENTYAYSDFLLSFAPPYWLARGLGFEPFEAYVGWLLFVFWLNYVAAFALLRWSLPASRLASALGAFLIAFPVSHLNQVSHPQLLPMFFVLLAIGGALAYGRHLESLSGNRRARRWSLGVVALSTVAQLYGGFYLGFFLLLALVTFAVAGLAQSALRRPLLAAWRDDLWALSGWGLGAALLLVPWAQRYGAAAGEVGLRQWSEVVGGLPRLTSWLFVAPASHFYDWMRDTLPVPDSLEQAVGVGLLTTGVVVATLVSGRRHLAMRWLGSVALLLVAVTTAVGGVSLWRVFFELVPGVSAVRVLCRLGLLLLPLLAGVTIAWLVDRAGSGWRPWVVGLALLCCVEQLGAPTTYDAEQEHRLVERLAEQVDPEKTTFLISQRGGRIPNWLLHIDAIWVAEVAGTPSVNGYSGKFPARWTPALMSPRSGNKGARQNLWGELYRWLAVQGADPADVQLLQLRPRYRKPEAKRGPYCY
ncbi:MAG: hypothetical protein AAF604_20255 [Acidobacteriota bacterium]